MWVSWWSCCESPPQSLFVWLGGCVRRGAGVSPASQAPLRDVGLTGHGHRAARPPPVRNAVALRARGSRSGCGARRGLGFSLPRGVLPLSSRGLPSPARLGGAGLSGALGRAAPGLALRGLHSRCRRRRLPPPALPPGWLFAWFLLGLRSACLLGIAALPLRPRCLARTAFGVRSPRFVPCRRLLRGG